MDSTVFSPAPQPRAARSRRQRTLIGLTPLIDVVFILLVFFMLASSFQDWRRIELDTPARPVAGVAAMEGALLVEIRPNGVRLSAEPVSLGALVSRVGRRVAAQPGLRVLVKPAPGVVLQEMIRVLDALAAAGATGMSLVSDPNGRVLRDAL